ANDDQRRPRQDIMKTLVRPAKPSDTTAMAEIGADTFALACPPSTSATDLQSYIDSELTAARFTQHLACSSTSLFVAEINEFVAGYLMLCREDMPAEVRSRSAIELRRIYVRSQYHGWGVASALMAEAIKTARI